MYVFVGQLKAGKEKLPHSFITCVICPKGHHTHTHSNTHAPSNFTGTLKNFSHKTFCKNFP